MGRRRQQRQNDQTKPPGRSGEAARGSAAGQRRQAPSHAPRAWPLAAFLGATLLLKLTVVAQLGGHPLLQPDAGLDTQSYVQLAERVLGGDFLLGPGLYYVSPLYLYFLAGALFAFDSLIAVRVIQALLGTAGVYAIYVTGREWFGERAGWLAAALAALTGVFTFYEIVLLQSALDPALTAAGLCALTFALTRTSPGWALAAGGIFGIQALNRPNILIAAAAVALALLAARRWRLGVLVAAGVCLGLSPAVVRNLAVSHQLALGSSQGGLNLYIGNHAGATGQYTPVAGVRASIEGQSEDTRRGAEAATGRTMTDAEVSGYFAGQAITWARTHPADAMRLFIRKIALTFSASHQWLDLSYPYYAHDTGSILWLMFVGPWLLVPLGLAGLAAGGRRRAGFIVWAVFIPAYAVAVAVFFVAERYRLPLLVALCVSGGAVIDAAAAAVATRRWRSLAVPASAAALAGVVTFWPHHLEDGRFDERLRLSKVLMNRGDFTAAVDELRRAHEIDPSHTVAEFNLGMALVGAGNAQEGIPFVRHAVDAGVPLPGARYALASAMLRSGDAPGAAALLRGYQPDPADSPESCVQVAALARAAGEPAVAGRYLRRALELRPGWDVPRAMLEDLGRPRE
jgi:4-amino-4-deoxy-L-arabinose transferase-like glycosyltransferase